MAKQLSVKVTDIEALKTAYPELVTEKTIVQQVINKAALYQIAKALHPIKKTIPGVSITSGDEEESAPAVEPTHNQLG